MGTSIKYMKIGLIRDVEPRFSYLLWTLGRIDDGKYNKRMCRTETDEAKWSGRPNMR